MRPSAESWRIREPSPGGSGLRAPRGGLSTRPSRPQPPALSQAAPAAAAAPRGTGTPRTHGPSWLHGAGRGLRSTWAKRLPGSPAVQVGWDLETRWTTPLAATYAVRSSPWSQEGSEGLLHRIRAGGAQLHGFPELHGGRGTASPSQAAARPWAGRGGQADPRGLAEPHSSSASGLPRSGGGEAGRGFR